jgi:hypothetical protein
LTTRREAGDSRDAPVREHGPAGATCCRTQRSSLWKKYTVLAANMPNNATPIAIARSITPPDPSWPDRQSYREVIAE